MKSIQTRILIWCFAIVFGSLVAIIGFAAWQTFTGNGGPARLVREMSAMQAEDMAGLLAVGDRNGLAAYLARIESHFEGRYAVVDQQGRNVLTGENLGRFLAAAPKPFSRPVLVGGEGVVVVPVPDGRHMLLIRRPLPAELMTHIPYFLFIVGAMALFCSILAVRIARPLRRMADGVSRFGAGELNARLRVDRNDEIGRLGSVFDDMADRIQTLVQSERQLLQDISHELRSPLARLGVGVQLAKREGKREEAITLLEREVERLGELVGDLVAMTKAEGDLGRAQRQPIRLDLLMHDIADACAIEAGEKGSQIRAENRAGEVELPGNPQLLWRAVENILRNAIHHSQPGMAVEMDLARGHEKAEVELSIRDHGPGVSDRDLSRIFRPFYRTDPSRNSDTGGVGLGLAIAQRAINLHHGAIYAENAQPGLRVVIRLPLPSPQFQNS